MPDITETAEFFIVRGEKHLMIAADAHGDDIVGVGVLRIKVEDEDQTAALIGQPPGPIRGECRSPGSYGSYGGQTH